MIRLLNVNTLEFQEFNDTNRPRYVIASHCWGEEEVTYKDVLKRRNKANAGYKKILQFCEVVKNPVVHPTAHEYFDWIWIDTCCIDKDSSAEVSEAVNTMYRWYAESVYCIAWLHDVDFLQEWRLMDALKKSRWFTRGWTLQELLAPRDVIFVDRNWSPCGFVGQFGGLSLTIANVTGIPIDALNSRYVDRFGRWSIEEKKRWMQNRQTTRIEDMAYCQLGLFGVTMPLVYGEREEAMVRLDKAIQEKKERYEKWLKQQQKNNEKSRDGERNEKAEQVSVTAHTGTSFAAPKEWLTGTRDWPAEFHHRRRLSTDSTG